MGIQRKVVVGHWQEPAVQEKLNTWMRAACAWHDAQGGKIAVYRPLTRLFNCLL
jgi:L-arabinose isomerase